MSSFTHTTTHQRRTRSFDAARRFSLLSSIGAWHCLVGNTAALRLRQPLVAYPYPTVHSSSTEPEELGPSWHSWESAAPSSPSRASTGRRPKVGGVDSLACVHAMCVRVRCPIAHACTLCASAYICAYVRGGMRRPPPHPPTHPTQARSAAKATARPAMWARQRRPRR